eukprot:COSAG01_NODE_1389_length_10493_cov_12.367414_3_plen_315_part_00
MMSRGAGMSEGVDNAAVMLSCVSLAYKESANCRLEAQYGHQRRLPLIPLMMEADYRPTGWLGLLLGCKLYINFHPAALASDAAFQGQMDAVERELQGLGKCAAASMSEGVPPSLARQQPVAAAEPPLTAPGLSSVCAPVALGGVPDPLDAAPLTPGRFTPSFDHLSSPSPSTGGLEAVAPSVAAAHVDLLLGQQRLMLEREEQLRTEMRQQMKMQMEQLREEIQPRPAISEQQTTALQVRLKTLHDAELLSDDECCVLEDAIADWLGLEASMGVVTREVAHAHESVGKLLVAVALSERMADDRIFSRQVRRKCL